MEDNTFILSNDTEEFLEHFLNINDNHEDIALHEASHDYRLCSHANTCRFKRDNSYINKCMHTKTCEYFCQKFISTRHLKTRDMQFEIDLDEAKNAKRDGRRRRIH